jgi:hypothetical protein
VARGGRLGQKLRVAQQALAIHFRRTRRVVDEHQPLGRHAGQRQLLARQRHHAAPAAAGAIDGIQVVACRGRSGLAVQRHQIK